MTAALARSSALTGAASCMAFQNSSRPYQRLLLGGLCDDAMAAIEKPRSSTSVCDE